MTLLLLYWSVVTVVAAALNMRVSDTFSWSELAFDAAIGAIHGAALYAGTRPDAGAAAQLALVASHGVPGWLAVSSAGFGPGQATTPADLSSLCGALGAFRIAATLWAAGGDRLAASLGPRADTASLAVSLLVAPAKLPFALVTSAVGLLIWIGGAVWAAARQPLDEAEGPRVGFASGVFFTELWPTARGYHSTALGWTVHTWFGRTPFRHELFHTRQYIYMSDWLVPFWILGALWGLISARIAGLPADARAAFAAYPDRTREIGNPIEIAPYRLPILAGSR